MNKIKAKTFIQALKLVSSNPLSVKKYLSDNRLTQNEKKILKAYLHFRNANYDEVFNLIDKIDDLDQEIYAQKNLLMGLTLANLGRFEQAVIFYSKAEAAFRLLDLPYYLMIVLINLFTTHLNCYDKAGIRNVGKELIKFDLKKMERPERILRCLYHYYRFEGENDIASKIRKELFSIYPKMSEADQITYQLDSFHLAIRENQLAEARTVMEKIKRFKKYYSTENFRFMHKVMGYLENDMPIYFHHQDFEAVPFLFNQINCLHFLEQGKTDQAHFFWNQLEKQFPKIYHGDFSYVGDICLFSMALEKAKKQIVRNKPKIDTKGLTKKQLILKVLCESLVPVNQEDLFQAVWGRPVQDKNDLILLSRAIYRIKTEQKIDIQSRRKCYFIKPQKKKVS
jgi:tetratricopeptide (TPR) repeat protein